MMTACNDARIGRWAITRQLLLLVLLAPLALTGCPGTAPSDSTEPTEGDPVLGAGDNVAPSPLLDTLDGTLAEGDTLQGQVGIALSFDATGSADTDGTVTGYEWDFGDGSSIETEASVAHSYAEPGEYTVTLTVIDDAAERTTLTITVVISGADPVASFTVTPTSGQAPLTVSFDASASIDSDGIIVAYTWDPGDGSALFGGVTSSYTYETGGTFTATLTVDDSDGHSGSMSVDIEVQVSNQVPLAVVVATPLTGPEPLTVNFDATGSSDPDGTIATYQWDYGDGSDLGAGAETSHEYTTAGTYTAELTVTDNEGATTSAPVEITVDVTNLAPTAMIGADPTSGPAPLTVSFDAAGSSDPEDGTDLLKYLWDFGESTCVDSGGTNLEITCEIDTDCPSDATCNPIIATDTPTPVHTYSVDGIYTATLTVSDELNLAGASVTIAIEVTGSNVVGLAADTTCLELDPTDPAETHQLLVTGTLSDASELDVTADADTIYASDDDTIATVDATGLITAVADGTATVTVSRVDTSVPSVSVTVYVSAATLYDSLKVEPSPIALEVGNTQQLTVEGLNICDPTQTDDLHDDPDTEYLSDATGVATVDSVGLITAQGAGTAIITVSRADGSASPEDVTVTVTLGTLSASVVVSNLPTEGFYHPGMNVQLDLDIVGGVGDPETDDFTYDWNLDVTGAPGSSLADSDFMDEDTKVTSFRPDVEGDFVVNCVVTDNVGTVVTTSNVTITAIALTAEPIVMGNDGCVVGPPSDFVPPGADGPGSIQEEHTFVTLEANVTGELGDLAYLWSATANDADFGSFDDPTLATPVWNIPLVTEETEVIFTVIVADDVHPVQFDSVPWMVSPAMELSAIVYIEPAQATVDFPVTFLREEDSGTAPRIFRFRVIPDGVTVGGDCVEGGGVTDFDVVQLDCTMNFPSAGDYTMTVEVRDSCADQTQDNPKPLIAYDFTVNVIE